MVAEPPRRQRGGELTREEWDLQRAGHRLPGLNARADATGATAQVLRRSIDEHHCCHGGGGEGAGKDRKSVVSGKSVSVRVDIGGCRTIKKKHNKSRTKESH